MAWYNSGNWSGLTVGTDLSYILRDLVLALNERRTFAGLSAITVNTMNGSKSSPVQADFVGTPVAEIGTRYITPLRNGVANAAVATAYPFSTTPTPWPAPVGARICYCNASDPYYAWASIGDFLTDAIGSSAWTTDMRPSNLAVYTELKDAIDHMTHYSMNALASLSGGAAYNLVDYYEGAGWPGTLIGTAPTDGGTEYSVDCGWYEFGGGGTPHLRVWKNHYGRLFNGLSLTGSLVKTWVIWLHGTTGTNKTIDVSYSGGNTFTLPQVAGGSYRYEDTHTSWPALTENLSLNWTFSEASRPYDEPGPSDNPATGFFRPDWIRVVADVSGSVSY